MGAPWLQLCLRLCGSQHVVCPPLPIGPPPGEVSLQPLLEVMQPDSLVGLFAAVLLEQRVLLRVSLSRGQCMAQQHLRLPLDQCCAASRGVVSARIGVCIKAAACKQQLLAVLAVMLHRLQAALLQVCCCVRVAPAVPASLAVDGSGGGRGAPAVPPQVPACVHPSHAQQPGRLSGGAADQETAAAQQLTAPAVHQSRSWQCCLPARRPPHVLRQWGKSSAVSSRKEYRQQM